MQRFLPHYIWNTLGSPLQRPSGVISLLYLELKCPKKGPTGYPGPSRPSSAFPARGETVTAAQMPR